MIEIKDKTKCCGCSACSQICPKHCISMNSDGEGFLYPAIDRAICIDCHMCESVCPAIHEGEIRLPLSVYAAINPVESIRLKSSSGGIFSALAEKVIASGGIVYGAAFSGEFMVRHISVDNIDGLSKLRGSKYVQSNIGQCYAEVKKYLEKGKQVLFSGTQCQVAGLNSFLHKEYDNLLTVEVVCHGVPSPKVWRDYITNILQPQLKQNESLSAIDFRDKSNGWKCYNFCAYSQRKDYPDETRLIFKEKFSENSFFKFFLRNMILRPSCYSCPAKSGRSGSDLSLGDYWGLPKNVNHIDDDKGVSLVLCNSRKGQQMLLSADLVLYESTLDSALVMNPCICESVRESPYRKRFWTIYSKCGITRAIESIDKFKPHLIKRCYYFIRRKLPKRKIQL